MVDHATQTYVEGCWGGSGTYGGADPGWIRELLAEGRYFEDGTEEVDGKELIRIRHEAMPDELGEMVPPARSALLVDPETYLPIVDRHYDVDGGLVCERRVEYLPRTPENLALVGMPAVPEGYRLVPPASDDRC
jgi:hypothetical protein